METFLQFFSYILIVFMHIEPLILEFGRVFRLWPHHSSLVVPTYRFLEVRVVQ